MADVDTKKPAMVEIPLEKLDRLLVLLERVAQNQERTLTGQQSKRDRAERKLAKAGPTSDAARAAVQRKLRKASGR